MHNTNDTLLIFPCDFPIKIMGKADGNFEGKILAIVREHSPDLGEGAIKIRHSKEGNYMSITAMIHAKSKQQLDNIYQALSSEELALVVL